MSNLRRQARKLCMGLRHLSRLPQSGPEHDAWAQYVIDQLDHVHRLRVWGQERPMRRHIREELMKKKEAEKPDKNGDDDSGGSDHEGPRPNGEKPDEEK